MPSTPKPLPNSIGVQFSTSDGIDAGVTRRRMRAQDLTRPFHGARRRKTDIAREDRQIQRDTMPLARTRALARRMLSKARSFLQVAPEGAFICGRSAAALRGLPVTPDDLLDVGTISPQRCPRGRGIRGRKIAPHLVSVDVIDGIPVSSAATTWAMLARDLSVRELVTIADAIVRVPRDSFGRLHAERTIATIDDLTAAVDAGRQVGVQRLRAALTRTRVGSASPLETEYRLDAEDAGLPDPELDVEIRDATGRLLGISEFVYRAYRVVVEIEGDHHRTSKDQWNRDLQKYRDYSNAGWEVVRLTAADIRIRRTATRIVHAVLRRHGWQPSR